MKMLDNNSTKYVFYKVIVVSIVHIFIKSFFEHYIVRIRLVRITWTDESKKLHKLAHNICIFKARYVSEQKNENTSDLFILLNKWLFFFISLQNTSTTELFRLCLVPRNSDLGIVHCSVSQKYVNLELNPIPHFPIW